MLGVAQQRVQGAPPPGDYRSWADYMADVEAVELGRVDREAQRGLKAMRLAPTRLVYEALVRGEPVPREALDPVWRRRYGL